MLLAAAIGFAASSQPAYGGAPAVQSSAADRPETGRQGETTKEERETGQAWEPYHKGVRLVGHTDIWNRGANLNMAWVDGCAYVSTAKGSGPQAANSTSAEFLKEPAGVAVSHRGPSIKRSR